MNMHQQSLTLPLGLEHAIRNRAPRIPRGKGAVYPIFENNGFGQGRFAVPA
jgi:hypothetical protein